MSPDASVAAVASKQHGVFTKDQARALGLTDGAIRHRIATGRWVPQQRGVYALSGTPPTWEQKAAAATLTSRGIASATTAARLLGILERADGPIHVTLPPGQKRTNRPGITFHEASLTRADIRKIRNIPATGPNRTLIDLAAVVAERALESALDDAIQLGLTTIPALDTYIRDRKLAHNPGVKVLRKLMNDRAKGAMHKALERMFRRKLRASGLPEPIRQYRVGSRKIDFAYPERRIAIELDGLGGHFSAEAFRRDKRRNNEIVLAGFDLLHFTWEDVDVRWRDVEATVRQALGMRASSDGEG